MARYKDIELLDVVTWESDNEDFDKGVNFVLEKIDSLPTADVAEVKHGEWIEQEDMGDVYYTCSQCRNDWTTIDDTPQENFMNYCPNCGADMRGGKNV